jgi:hypothetical protein
MLRMEHLKFAFFQDFYVPNRGKSWQAAVSDDS